MKGYKKLMKTNFNYPTVYIVHHPEKKKFVFILVKRQILDGTEQHLKQEAKRKDWEKLSRIDNANMFDWTWIIQ